ncbi:hypothetical protein EAN04_24490 [Salmonella enterica]|nr:hypothetical protein [Salmonella enterica]
MSKSTLIQVRNEETIRQLSLLAEQNGWTPEEALEAVLKFILDPANRHHFPYAEPGAPKPESYFDSNVRGYCRKAVIAKIEELRDKGKSWIDVANELNRLGYLTVQGNDYDQVRARTFYLRVRKARGEG